MHRRFAPVPGNAALGSGTRQSRRRSGGAFRNVLGPMRVTDVRMWVSGVEPRQEASVDVILSMEKVPRDSDAKKMHQKWLCSSKGMVN